MPWVRRVLLVGFAAGAVRTVVGAIGAASRAIVVFFDSLAG